MITRRQILETKFWDMVTVALFAAAYFESHMVQSRTHFGKEAFVL